MPQQNDRDLRLAVLIDADNASRTAMRDVMAEIAVYGTPTIKRIYGDWTTPNMASWKPILLENAITPIQQYSYTTGKNSTDSAMIIDAMDVLYTGRCDGFVIVSSDSDFTRLAIRLREAGMKVIGMGEKKTPQPFIASCDKFVYIEVIRGAGGGCQRRAGRRQAGGASRRQEPEGPEEGGRGSGACAGAPRAGAARRRTRAGSAAGDGGSDRRRAGDDRGRGRLRLHGRAGKPAGQTETRLRPPKLWLFQAHHPHQKPAPLRGGRAADLQPPHQAYLSAR